MAWFQRQKKRMAMEEKTIINCVKKINFKNKNTVLLYSSLFASS